MSIPDPVNVLEVKLCFREDPFPVGRLALRDHRIYFEYYPSFLGKGLNISPFMLPLREGIHTFESSPFEGLPGLFNDSLPDGWGRLLFDRYIMSKGLSPREVSPLDRLAHVGTRGLGALTYDPEVERSEEYDGLDLDHLASQVTEVLQGDAPEVIEELLALNGSSAGARPKAMIDVSDTLGKIRYGGTQTEQGFSPWIVKFPNTQDGTDAGAVEYIYALMAKDAGVITPQVHLFRAEEGPGYFAVRRSDRDGNRRLHMHSVSGLMHADHRLPALDYEEILSLTFMLTRDIREVEKMYRLAVFNVLAHNRDDHAKNFSFLMDESGQWKLSPAYDLTFSSGPGGEQSTLVLGEGRSVDREQLVTLGLRAKVPKPQIRDILDQTQSALSRWPALAAQYGVNRANASLIRKSHCL